MNGKLELSITPEDLQYEIQQLVESIAADEIRKLVKQTAAELVRKEVGKILEPLVVSVLTDEKFDFQTGWHSYKHKADLEGRIKRYVIDFLDQPCYLYSSSSSKPSERLRASSSNSEMSRLEHFMRFAIEKYFDEHINKKMELLVKKYVIEKSNLQEIAKNQMKSLLENQLK